MSTTAPASSSPCSELPAPRWILEAEETGKSTCRMVITLGDVKLKD
uniref:Uncharacterized protein n=1 Tax=Arundo donax TaxID=35708 RepID=A0A0A9FSW6_ARUDO